MVHKLLSGILLVTLVLSTGLVRLTEARQPEEVGRISGVASTAGAGTLAIGVTVQLRDLNTMQVIGTLTTDADGQFVFVGLGPGDYVVEIVDEQGTIAGTTAPITLSRGAMVKSGIALLATAGGAALVIAGVATAPALADDQPGAPASSTGDNGTSNLFGSSVAAVTFAANGSRQAAGTVPSRGTASPSR
jgi:hypothetical protein